MFETADQDVQRKDERGTDHVPSPLERPVQLLPGSSSAGACLGGDGSGTKAASALSHWAEPVQMKPGSDAGDQAPRNGRQQQIQQAIATIQSMPPPRTVESNDELGKLFREFRAANRQRTFTEGALSWLNNLAATSERAYKSITGDPERKYWGCADSAPALLSFFQQSYHGGEYKFENLTSRNVLGLQHNQVIAVPLKPGLPRRVFDPWAWAEVPYEDNHDHTFVAVGQALELIVTQDVEPTGYGETRAVTGNKDLSLF